LKLTFQDYISIKIHKTDLILTSFVKAKLEPFNLAPEQNLIMMQLWEQEGITQNQLVECLQKDKTNIARMASNLESKGFIKRISCQEDRRAIRLYLTEEGKELGKKVLPVAEQFNETITEGITTEEILQLERILTKINTNAQKQMK